MLTTAIKMQYFNSILNLSTVAQ